VVVARRIPEVVVARRIPEVVGDEEAYEEAHASEV
jgi:hypothetical protein